MNRALRNLIPGCCLAVALLLACLAQAATPLADARPSVRKQILLLNSYHQNFLWNESIFRGLTDVLRPNETGIILHVENMDTKRVVFNEHSQQQLRDVFGHKYRGMTLDLIMVTDSNAFDFMRRYHQALFPEVPVVFCGVNFFTPDLIADHPLFTGVAETLDIRGTLWWALNHHPGTASVHLINDTTPLGRAVTRGVKADLATFAPDVTLHTMEAADLDELLEKVDKLPRNSLILYGVYFRTPEGRFHDTAEVLRAVSARASVPIYGLYDFDLGHGIVGGMLTSGYAQGQAMAQIALHVLAGRHPQDIPVIRESAPRPMFDYEQLRKYRIGMDALPENSEIINRPTTFYSEHMNLFWFGMIFTVVQMIIIFALIANTSRRKRAETELRKTHQSLEERVRERTSEVKETMEALRTVFDASHDAIFIHDVTGRILEANERMLKMYGLSADQIHDVSIARDISSRDNAVYRLSSYWRSVLNGEPQNFEWKARRPHDGAEFDVEVYLNRIVFHGQEAILTNVRDITVRKESENRIRQTLSKFEAILENSLMGIAMSKGRRLATINRRGAEIFGRTPAELVGSELAALLSSSNAVTDFVRTARDALSQSGEFNTEQAFLDSEGNTVWCRMYAKAVDQGSLDKGVIWAWDDITAQRRAQDDLMRAREDAEAANRAKSEFLAAMSHEIRTPMNAIVGMTDITLQTSLTTEQRDYLKTVMDSAQHLLGIINDILDLSKIEARKLCLDRVDFDLPSHVRTTLKGLEMQARQKGLDFVLELDQDVPACVKGDPLSLRQVLMNLVGNAIKFTHKGSIRVLVSPAQAQPDADDQRTVGVRFEVADTGIGIPESFMGTIFQSFSQTTRAFGGTGLGLAICKQLIGLMGGDISVTSTMGRGSVFSFVVRLEPGVACPVDEEPGPVRPPAPYRPLHILVAEDNEVNIMVTTLRLKEMGHSFALAKTGLEVLEQLRREPFDLILMDIEMPVLDGISTTKAIRAALPDGPIPNPAIPIIGVTAHALKEFRDRSLDAGMDDYVAKPVNFNELALIINRLAGGDTGQPAPPEANPQPDAPEPADAPTAMPDAPDAPWTPGLAMERLGVDETVFQGFLDTARTELTAMELELRQAMGAGNDAGGAALAHTIGSICASIGASRAARAARSLEAACRAQNEARPALEALEAEMASLRGLMDGN
ncbi:MAG: PAS domain S-box protein [Proteobacteria bacterium]|nr:PAS domain S-box protein [Pseudomonadota bacterium]